MYQTGYQTSANLNNTCATKCQGHQLVKDDVSYGELRSLVQNIKEDNEKLMAILDGRTAPHTAAMDTFR